jgi:LysM repeat protein
MNPNSSKMWHCPVVGLSLLLTLVILASFPSVEVAAAAAKTTCDKTYEVRRGDTLQKIGDRFGYAPSQVVYVNSWKAPYTIYVGQKICIPTSKVENPPKVNSTYANAPAAYFTAGRTASDVLVYPYNYPATNVVVKVDNAGDSVKKYIDVGRFTIGNGKTWRFKLPAELKNAAKLTICLKDMSTSNLQCVAPRSGS